MTPVSPWGQTNVLEPISKMKKSYQFSLLKSETNEHTDDPILKQVNV